jgi:hypothetical protein
MLEIDLECDWLTLTFSEGLLSCMAAGLQVHVVNNVRATLTLTLNGTNKITSILESKFLVLNNSCQGSFNWSRVVNNGRATLTLAGKVFNFH